MNRDSVAAGTAALFLLAAGSSGEHPCTRCDTIAMAAAGELALLPGDRWQDGQPVTAREVACSFEASAALNADAPALFVSTPVQVAAASRRVEGLQIDPDSWLSGLPAVSLEA